MTPSQLKRFRLQNGLSLLDVSARTGLPTDYIEKIEEEQIAALQSDLERLKKAILQAAKEKEDPDYEGDIFKRPLDDDDINEELS